MELKLDFNMEEGIVEAVGDLGLQLVEFGKGTMEFYRKEATERLGGLLETGPGENLLESMACAEFMRVWSSFQTMIHGVLVSGDSEAVEELYQVMGKTFESMRERREARTNG